MKTTEVTLTNLTVSTAKAGATNQRTNKAQFSPELRERAVRLVYEQRKEFGSH